MSSAFRLDSHYRIGNRDACFVLDRDGHWSLWKAVQHLPCGKQVFAFRHNAVSYAYAEGKPVPDSLVMAIVYGALDPYDEAVNLGSSNELVKARTGAQFRPLYAHLKGLTATVRELLDQFWATPPPTVRAFHGERAR